MRIVCVTSAHPRYDTRIYVKQCKSLAMAGHEVWLVVADGKGNECAEEPRLNHVNIVDVGLTKGRLRRITMSARRAVDKAHQLNPDVVILHDPELLPWAWRLKRETVSTGKCGHRVRVVFDSHEDVPTQILNKPYLHPQVLRLVSAMYEMLERFICRRLDGMLAATNFIADRLACVHPNTVAICNYPSLQEFSHSTSAHAKQHAICYIGGITRIRGAIELVDAMGLVAQTDPTLQLNLAGAFENESLRLTMQARPGWKQVNELGHQSREGVQATLLQSCVGLVTLHPTPAYKEALPVKMFEYMAAGIPIVASNFPLWAGIVDAARCGVCVDPLDPRAIADAILQLMQNPQQARLMGENGRQAVLTRYNWDTQERKLLAFVNDLA